MQRTAVINIVGLCGSLIGDHTPRLKAFASGGSLARIDPAFPAVTCTAQYDYVTGKRHSEHGIVGNGWYNRDLAEVQFWKQPERLVRSPKIWDELKAADPSFTCAKLFWWYNMYSSADYSITPRPMYPADGRKVFDVYTHPMTVRHEIKKDLGEFPFPTFWGPLSASDSSRWIAGSARWFEEKHSPTLSLIYLPHLDYNLQRLGPGDPAIAGDLEEIDTIAGELIDFFTQRGIRVAVLSEYGIEGVNTPVHLNRVFRDKRWITVKDELGLELLDCGASRAFAVADHQVAHIYINDPSIEPEVRRVLERTAGVAEVLGAKEKNARGLDHPRAGELIAIAAPRCWFTYYYWNDDRKAPDFARCVDIHRKPGFDPVELFLDPEIRFPRLKLMKFFLKKKLGFRTLLDVIPLDPALVKGSHGRIPEDEGNHPVFITGHPVPDLPASIGSTNVKDRIRQMVAPGRNE